MPLSFCRTTEGEYGDILVTVVAKMSPKSAQTVRVRVKPLSLHQRVNELTREEEARPKNTLRLTGSFSVSLMHEWISLCLPEVSPYIRLYHMDPSSSSPQIFVLRNYWIIIVWLLTYEPGAPPSDFISGGEHLSVPYHISIP